MRQRWVCSLQLQTMADSRRSRVNANSHRECSRILSPTGRHGVSSQLSTTDCGPESAPPKDESHESRLLVRISVRRVGGGDRQCFRVLRWSVVPALLQLRPATSAATIDRYRHWYRDYRHVQRSIPLSADERQLFIVSGTQNDLRIPGRRDLFHHSRG